ncbi:MAG: hypothetical protein AAB972_03330 [Patescibacteria group bacterium]
MRRLTAKKVASIKTTSSALSREGTSECQPHRPSEQKMGEAPPSKRLPRRD